MTPIVSTSFQLLNNVPKIWFELGKTNLFNNQFYVNKVFKEVTKVSKESAIALCTRFKSIQWSEEPKLFNNKLSKPPLLLNFIKRICTLQNAFNEINALHPLTLLSDKCVEMS